MTGYAIDGIRERLLDMLGRSSSAKNKHIDHVRDTVQDRDFDLDVCIVTNCTSGGGNALSTLSELEVFSAAGLRTLLVHCTTRKSPWKAYWLFSGYTSRKQRIAAARDVASIRCRTAIIRAPKAIMSDSFLELSGKMRPDHAIFVVNNSAWNEAGRAGYDWPSLIERIDSLNWPSTEICPIGPNIRHEGEETLRRAKCASKLSHRDWPPVFDESRYPFSPQARLDAPIRIGRHARDHPAKWLENIDELFEVYPPNNPKIRVEILGGAETVRDIAGTVPESWIVHPFDTRMVARYLETLDFFVFFPASARKEAFGRTIIEAVLAGLPVILPPSFNQTFGDLAFYCKPSEVQGLIARLAQDNEGRMRHIERTRREAIAKYGKPSLMNRLEIGGTLPEESFE